MNDKQMKLTTKKVFYDLNSGVAFYDQKGKIVNDKNTLTSDLGYYYSKEKNLFFKNNVILINPDYLRFLSHQSVIVSVLQEN